MEPWAKEMFPVSSIEVTWLDASKQFSVDTTINRAETLAEKLKAMATNVKGKAKITISRIIETIYLWISILKEWALGVTKQGSELKDASLSKISSSFKELKDGSLSKMSSSLKEIQQSTAGYTLRRKEQRELPMTARKELRG